MNTTRKNYQYKYDAHYQYNQYGHYFVSDRTSKHVKLSYKTQKLIFAIVSGITLASLYLQSF